MGACCSKNADFGGVTLEDDMDANEYGHENEEVLVGDGGATVRVRGSSKYVSMAIKQGKKGINQDAMTVWENFTGEKDMFFCGVFDGHGPLGHKIAHYVQENLPPMIQRSVINSSRLDENIAEIDDEKFFRGLEANLVKSFKELDEELSLDSTYDSFCSGTTAVTIIKQGDRLVIGNLGDSRSVLCTRGSKNQLVPIQLTVDLKPNVPSESERIKTCKGRVFAMDEEPGVYRVWMPDDDCPGLAMSRAFGDFCLKDYGLISIPEISYRNLTSKDEFIVLATDGIWDVLSNYEVMKIVASAKNRSVAAENLIHRAVRAWRTKYPCSSADDCSVIILFLKDQQTFDKSLSELNSGNLSTAEFRFSKRSRSTKSEGGGGDECGGFDDEVTRVNSMLRLPRFGNVLSHRR